MLVSILTDTAKPNGFRIFTAQAGKTVATVTFFTSGTVSIVVDNAAHRAWRGGGRAFRSMADAWSAYKSGEMKAILEAAAQAGTAKTG